MTKSFGPMAGAALLSAWGQNRQRSEGRTRVSRASPGPKGEQAPPRTPRWKRRSVLLVRPVLNRHVTA
jgi:hypothetical protein